MKFEGNNPISEPVHPDPDQKPVLHPKFGKLPDQSGTIEGATEIEIEINESEPSDPEGTVPASPPVSNVIPFHKPRKRRVPDQNL
jgi:hypothetical protein